MARLSEANISLDSQVSFLMKERVLYREGPAALLAQIAPSAPIDPSRPRGNAGQPLLTTQELYDLFDEIRLPSPVKRAKRPDGDGTKVRIGTLGGCPSRSVLSSS